MRNINHLPNLENAICTNVVQHIVQSRTPRNAILLEQLKTLEEQLLKRDLIAPRHPEVLPLWFLADTEKNIFLWRNGFSLEQATEFEFWIDSSALIQKRLKLRKSFEEENPFRTLQCEEEKYLESLEFFIDRNGSYISAFGEACIESMPHGERKIVVLPSVARG